LIMKFNEKYILEVTRDKLTLKFQELEQGQMTITLYDVRFTQLSRYAGGLVREKSEKTNN